VHWLLMIVTNRTTAALRKADPGGIPGWQGRTIGVTSWAAWDKMMNLDRFDLPWVSPAPGGVKSPAGGSCRRI